MSKNKLKSLKGQLDHYRNQSQQYGIIIKKLLETLSEELHWDDNEIKELNLLLEKRVGPECRLQLRGRV
jgi:hypothetical protein